MWVIARLYEAMGGKQTMCYLAKNRITLSTFKHNAFDFEEEKKANDFIIKNRMQFFEAIEITLHDETIKKSTKKTKRKSNARSRK